MEENLSKVASVTSMLEAGNSPEKILEILLDGLDVEITETSNTMFYCNCSKDRVEKALISIGKGELQDMIEDGEPIEVKCHFCNKGYEFTIEDLKKISQKIGR